MKRAALITLALCLPFLNGCGTFADAFAGPVDDHLYYRGVRMDFAGIKNGMPLMVLDVPFSACADTLLVPSIAFRQLTDPNGSRHKSMLQATGEELTKAVVTDVMIPATVGAMRAADAEAQRQSSADVAPTGLRNAK